MLSRLLFLFNYVGFWVAYFAVGRIVFLLYQWQETSRLDAALVRGALLHGMRMDLVVACCFAAIPLVVVARSGFIPRKAVRLILSVYTVAALALTSVVIVADLELFSAWGFRVDVSPLGYLVTPREAAASAGAAPLPLLLGLVVAFVTFGFLAFRFLLSPALERLTPLTQPRSLLFIAASLPLLIVGGRGGPSLRMGMTAGVVYFSRDNYANQAAINPVWNLAASAQSTRREQTVLRYTDDETAKKIVDSLIAHGRDATAAPTRSLLRARPEKIIVLFWEGLTAKIVEPLGGMRGITPGFTGMYRDGILFDSLYAAGRRTTDGLVATLSGFPAHPRTKVLLSQYRTAALPSLAAPMREAGYRTGFYYGGRLEFDNRNRYLYRGHYDEIVDKRAYDPNSWDSPWGVHDEHMLERLYRAIDETPGRQFAVGLTLSSHEPYDVPAATVIPGNDNEQKFLNSHVYTDRVVARFVERARGSSWWNNTLLIIIADHGHPRPIVDSTLFGIPENYRIPMLWLGGALAVTDTVISRIASQVDFPSTLLSQLGIRSSDFPWSRDMFATGGHEFAFYTFRDVFGYVDRSGVVVFDNVGSLVAATRGQPRAASLAAGRAYQQRVMQEYIDLAQPPAPTPNRTRAADR